MDCNFKTTSLDFHGFQREEIPNTDTDSGSSSLGGQQIKENFSVDLKLGQVVDSGNGLMDNVKIPSVPKTELSPLGSSKRARSMSNGIQTVSCLVDGCSADLSVCREYHRRHKVCEVHSKTPTITISGHKKRFCQQCSRFHSLEEFDEGKRSCRKRLEGHNRRRRKPQPEPLSHSGSFISNYQATTAAGHVWAEDVKPYEDGKHPQWHLQDKQNPYSVSCSNNDMGGGKQLSFLQGTNLLLSNQTTAKSSLYQPLVNAFGTSESGDGNYKMFCDGLPTRVVHSDCALSLLSSSSSETSDFNLSYMIHSNPVSVAHPIGSGLQCNNLESEDSILVPNASDVSIHCQGMFHTGTEASPDNETQQALPFYWE